MKVMTEVVVHTVLNQRIARPAVHRQVAIYAGAVPRSVILDHARRTGVPSLTSHEVTNVRPCYIVRATGSVVVCHRAGTVGPERVVET